MDSRDTENYIRNSTRKYLAPGAQGGVLPVLMIAVVIKWLRCQPAKLVPVRARGFESLPLRFRTIRKRNEGNPISLMRAVGLLAFLGLETGESHCFLENTGVDGIKIVSRLLEDDAIGFLEPRPPYP